LQAISSIDIALWDLAGKAAGEPVYRLLGGATRHPVPVYASALHPVGADKVAAEAKDYVAAGYQAMKLRFPYGPGDGVKGMRANEEHVANIRDAVGDDIEIMADAYMGWDFLYAKKMCRRLEPYKLAWLEEAFIPDDLTSYAKLRQETNIPISGMHLPWRTASEERVRRRRRSTWPWRHHQRGNIQSIELPLRHSKKPARHACSWSVRAKLSLFPFSNNNRRRLPPLTRKRLQPRFEYHLADQPR
jgi:hypothetical protein